MREKLIKFVQSRQENRHGGVTEDQMAKALKLAKCELKDLLMELMREYVISCWVDQDRRLSFNQAARKPLRYFINLA
jgi:transcription initiation factor IIE alpha subunit